MNHFHIITVDLMGFGLSDRILIKSRELQYVSNYYTIPIVSLINLKKIEKFYILAHSMGGIVSVHLLPLISEKILGMFLVGTPGMVYKKFTKKDYDDYYIYLADKMKAPSEFIK